VEVCGVLSQSAGEGAGKEGAETIHRFFLCWLESGGWKRGRGREGEDCWNKTNGESTKR